MSQLVDTRVAELLVSRICHEVVGPIGAINNGVELIEEMGEDMAADAMGLIGSSAKQAAARVQFLRVAYGRTGRSETRAADLRNIATAALGNGRIQIDWPMGAIAPDIPDGMGGLILNLIELASGALPRGGRVEVEIGRQIAVIAEGQNPQISPELSAAIAGQISIDALTPRLVHGYWAGMVARELNRPIRLQPEGTTHLRLAV